MNGLSIDEDDFRGLDLDTKMDVLFQNLVQIRKRGPCQIDKCNERFEKLESRKWFDKGLAAVTGLLGGAGAVAAKMVIWK